MNLKLFIWLVCVTIGAVNCAAKSEEQTVNMQLFNNNNNKIKIHLELVWFVWRKIQRSTRQKWENVKVKKCARLVCVVEAKTEKRCRLRKVKYRKIGGNVMKLMFICFLIETVVGELYSLNFSFYWTYTGTMRGWTC